MKIPFTKPAFSIEDQADLVIGRGLIADKDRLMRRLRTVGYYRLCGYWYHLKDAKENFRPNSDFEQVWRAYTFDRHLRMVVMEAIERVEVAIRCDVYSEIVMRHGPFGHRDPTNFPNAKGTQHAELINRLRDEARRSQEPFVLHFASKYQEFPDMPLWAAAQLMSFGSVLTMLNMCDPTIRPAIAAKYGFHDTLFKSWLLALNAVRNICAHHSRLWNRQLSVAPMVPAAKNLPEWHGPIYINNKRIWSILTILLIFQKQLAPNSRWRARVFKLFDDFPLIPLAPMGMPNDWRAHPLWK